MSPTARVSTKFNLPMKYLKIGGIKIIRFCRYIGFFFLAQTDVLTYMYELNCLDTKTRK